MMAWRLADSLVKLRNEVNAKYPNRSKASDGTIGDAAHSSRVSQHNPNTAGVVTAIDITHDPKNGPDGQQLADKLIQDSRAWYVIFNGRIRYQDGNWQNYSGSNPHKSHVHLSVKQDKANYDNKATWNITGKGGKEMATGKAVEYLFRAKLGRSPDKKQKEELMKVYDFDGLEAWIESLPEYKDNVKLLNEGKLNVSKFLVHPWNKVNVVQPVSDSSYVEAGEVDGKKVYRRK